MNSSPQKTSPSETAKGFLLITLICTLLLLRFYQINSYIINDFDTSSILLGIQGGFYEGYGAFFDIAHPGLLSFWVFAGNIITNLYNSPPPILLGHIAVPGGFDIHPIDLCKHNKLGGISTSGADWLRPLFVQSCHIRYFSKERRKHIIASDFFACDNYFMQLCKKT